MSLNKNSFFKHLRNYFREYCNSTSIHGFKYFGEKRTIVERIWWMIVFCITLGTLGYFIHEVYSKWKSSPIIVGFATRETPIHTIPFPAVTICPESKSDPTLFSYAKIYTKLVKNQSITEDERVVFDQMKMICDIRPENVTESTTEYLDEDFYNNLDDMNTIGLNVVICNFMGQRVGCNSLFKPIATDEGICYTFNMLKLSEIYKDNIFRYQIPFGGDYQANESGWTVEDGYPKRLGVDAFPRRALFSGYSNGLSVILGTVKSYSDPVCKMGFYGYRVVVHAPMRIPLTSQHFFRIPLNQELIGSIQPAMMETSDRIKNFDPSVRECYFPNEKNLTYFKLYTQFNCKLECVAKFLLEKCGCVNFYMPRKKHTKICGPAKRSCITDAENYFQTMNLREQMADDNTEAAVGGVCGCLPACTDISYEVQTSQSDWDWQSLFGSVFDDINSTLPVFDELVFSRLTLFFKYSQFVPSHRHELYGPTDFLANFGGLLGLFTGFSALSLMEIIYFGTVRIICNKRLYGLWSGQED